jgi:hypothetical protein
MDKRDGQYWTTIVPDSAWLQSDADWVAFQNAVDAFHALGNVRVLDKAAGVDTIVCTGGRLARMKTSTPHWMLKYRGIMAIVRQGTGPQRGTLVLLAIWRRDPDTYSPARLRALIETTTGPRQ